MEVYLVQVNQQEKLTDAEIDEIKKIDGLLNDFNKHTNIQSGVDQTDYGQQSLVICVSGGSLFYLSKWTFYQTHWTDVVLLTRYKCT